MNTIERRLTALERAEWDRIHQLPHREILAQGYIRLDRLPDAERRELEDLLAIAFDERGYIAYRQLKPEQRTRAVELLDHMRGRIP